MFSDRFGNAPPELNPQWKTKLALESAGVAILDLTQSNPTAVGLDYLDPLALPVPIPDLLGREAILKYAPISQGLLAARQAIAKYYLTRQRTIRAQDLILTASTSEAYSFLLKLLCNPGDEVLIPSPSYPLFDTLAELENVQLMRYRVSANGGLDAKLRGDMGANAESNSRTWQTDFNFLRSQISTRTKALILVNPNNPTGHISTAPELNEYLQIAREYNLALIVDEVFCDFLLGSQPFIPLVSEDVLVFTLNGFSKLLGLPQLKLGWIHVAGSRPIVDQALGHLEGIADAFLSVNTPVQLAATELLSLVAPIQSKLLGRLQANLLTAEKMLNASRHLKFYPPQAGWSLLLELAIPLTSESFALRLLEKHHVYVHGGYLFGFETGCQVVLSLLGPEKEFQTGLALLIQCGEAALHG